MIPAALMSRLAQLSLVSRRRPAMTLHGERQNRTVGNSLEFAEYRGYVPGDDPRRIDWNLYGRSNELFVKQFEAQQMLPVHILMDTSRSMDYGDPNKLSMARQLAAALGYVGLTGFDQVTVTILGHTAQSAARVIFGPASGRVRVPVLFSSLDNVQTGDAVSSGGVTDLDTAIANYVARHRKPGLALLLSDLLSPTAEAGLQRLLAARHELVVLHLLAPDELTPVAAEEVRLVDRETGRAVEVRLDQAALDRYRDRLLRWCTTVETLCRRNHARYVRLSTATPIGQVLLERLTRVGVLR